MGSLDCWQETHLITSEHPDFVTRKPCFCNGCRTRSNFFFLQKYLSTSPRKSIWNLYRLCADSDVPEVLSLSYSHAGHRWRRVHLSKAFLYLTFPLVQSFLKYITRETVKWSKKEKKNVWQTWRVTPASVAWLGKFLSTKNGCVHLLWTFF